MCRLITHICSMHTIFILLYISCVVVACCKCIQFVLGKNAEVYEKLLFNDDGTPTPRTDKIFSATPMGIFGKAEEPIGALLFLVSKDASSFVNGVVIPVDGGFSAYSGV